MVHIKLIAKNSSRKVQGTVRATVMLGFRNSNSKVKSSAKPPHQDMVKNALQVLYKSVNKYIILLRGNSSQIGLLGIQTNTLSSLGKLIPWFCLDQLYHTKLYGQNCLWPGVFKTTQRKPDIGRLSTHNKQSFSEGTSST